MTKSPQTCQNLQEIRQEIDTLDLELIDLLAKRAKYVHAAAQFKNSESDVAAPERFQQMLLQRKDWALRYQLSPEFIEDLFKKIVNYFIGVEKAKWKLQNK